MVRLAGNTNFVQMRGQPLITHSMVVSFLKRIACSNVCLFALKCRRSRPSKWWAAESQARLDVTAVVGLEAGPQQRKILVFWQSHECRVQR